MELHVVCNKCGEKLVIPSHLEEFSCMYCGARQTVTKESGDDAQAAAEYFKAHILEVITEHRDIEKSLTKNEYAPAIDAYEADCRKTFEQLDIACKTGSLSADDAADCFLDRLAEQWKFDLQKKKIGRNADSLRDSDKFIIAVFLVPMIRRLNLNCIEEFCTALHKAWLKRYPKSPWQIGDYDTISASFKKKFLGMCFITTAVCLEEGKADDCEELTAFRNFRDGYLQTCPDGASLIEEYYRTAPDIVIGIEKSSDPRASYAAIREEYLNPCYADLQAGNMAACKEHYTKMVRALQKVYLS